MNKEIKSLISWSAALLGASVLTFMLHLTGNDDALLSEPLSLALSGIAFALGIRYGLKAIVLAITGTEETEEVSA